MRITVLGTIYIDIKGYPDGTYIPRGRNAGRILEVHGGVARNVADNIARCGDDSVLLSMIDPGVSGQSVLAQLKNTGVDTSYILEKENGMGTWLAIFGDDGDVVASISKRQNLTPLIDVLKTHGDEIIFRTDCVAFELDMDADLVDKTLMLTEKYHRKAYALTSNMTVTLERISYFSKLECFVCNLQEAGMLFGEDFEGILPEKLAEILPDYIKKIQLRSMVVTMGGQGCVYADLRGMEVVSGSVPARNVDVIDTTGAGDAFFSGLVMSMIRGSTMKEACEKGTMLSASVIGSTENVCPVGFEL